MLTNMLSRILSTCSCSRKGMFAVQGTSDRTLSVTATFSPRGVFAIVFKLLLLCLSVTSLVLSIISNGGSLFFLAYLTNWGIVWTTLYSMLSFFNSIVKCRQPSSGDFVGIRPAITWLLFEIAAHTQIMVSILYWAMVYKPQWGLGFANIVAHGGLMAVLLLEGQVMNRIPVRWNHFPIIFGLHLVYLIWTLVHGIYEIGGPDHGQERSDNDDYFLYDVVDWTGNPKTTGTLALIIQLGIVPTLYGIMWLMSLPCRRYKRKSKKTKNGSNPTDDQTSVYTRITDDSTILSSDTSPSRKSRRLEQALADV